MTKIHLEMDQNQYQKLVEAVFLGTWMVNSTKLELDEDFEEIRELVLSKYKEAGLEDKVSYLEAFGIHDLEKDYEKQLFQDYVDEYEEHSFWDMLIEKLSEKKLKEEYGTIPTPLSDEMIERRLQIEEKIAQVLEEKGLTHLDFNK
ncbi:hypothetical protein [Halobacillus sp. Marseille-Q1614]|uniref:hypothetical protein n=1 Tax=Halobacillus sp. Marseille-Q1614 TaxID=2709134 RepID=UPI00157134C4|nr:hypothetical protein [Halobacillus sp. Marseille-Q1614]